MPKGPYIKKGVDVVIRCGRSLGIATSAVVARCRSHSRSTSCSCGLSGSKRRIQQHLALSYCRGLLLPLLIVVVKIRVVGAVVDVVLVTMPLMAAVVVMVMAMTRVLVMAVPGDVVVDGVGHHHHHHC